MKLLPSLQGFVRRNRHAIHRNFVRQETQNREACQKTDPDSTIRLFFPPASRHVVRSVALNEQGEKNVSVGYTRH